LQRRAQIYSANVSGHREANRLAQIVT